MLEPKPPQMNMNKTEDITLKKEEISAEHLENIKEVFKLNPDLKQTVAEALNVEDTEDIKIELGRNKENVLGKVQNINVYYKGDLIIDSDNVNKKLFLVTKEDGTSYVGDILLPEELQGKGLGVKILQKVSNELDTKIIPTYLSTGGFTSDNAKKMWEKVGNEIIPNHEIEKLYAKYLETIFPESKVKEIVWHNSDAEFKNEGFKPMKPNFDTLNSIEDVYNFSTNRNFVKKFGKNPYPAKLDIRIPFVDHRSGEYVDDMDRPLSEALFKIGKQKTPNALAPKYEENLKDTDGFVNYISGEEYIEKHPASGREFGIPKQTLVSVFDSSQIHILGSKQDIENFKNWVENQKKTKNETK